MAEVEARDWQRDGACRRADGSLFFSPGKDEAPEQRKQRIKAAKEICAQCPVWQRCRRYALENAEEFGVWGGLTEYERRKLIGPPRRR